MKQLLVSILLLIPMLGFGQEDKIFTQPDSINRIRANEFQLAESFYLVDTVASFSRIYTFDMYEMLPCTVYTAQEEISCYALMKTTYFRYGESGEYAPEQRWFVNFLNANEDVIFFKPGEVRWVDIIAHALKRRR